MTNSLGSTSVLLVTLVSHNSAHNQLQTIPDSLSHPSAPRLKSKNVTDVRIELDEIDEWNERSVDERILGSNSDVKCRCKTKKSVALCVEIVAHFGESVATWINIPAEYIMTVSRSVTASRWFK